MYSMSIFSNLRVTVSKDASTSLAQTPTCLTFSWNWLLGSFLSSWRASFANFIRSSSLGPPAAAQPSRVFSMSRKKRETSESRMQAEIENSNSLSCQQQCVLGRNPKVFYGYPSCSDEAWMRHGTGMGRHWNHFRCH